MPIKEEETNSSAFIKPFKGITRVLSDGYYGASYIPDQPGQYPHDKGHMLPKSWPFHATTSTMNVYCHALGLQAAESRIRSWCPKPHP
jgi:hypothetical protein